MLELESSVAGKEGGAVEISSAFLFADRVPNTLLLPQNNKNTSNSLKMASLSIAPHRIERKAGTGPLARSHMHRQRRVWPVALLLRFRSTARRGGSKPPRGLMKKVSLLRAGRSYYNGFIPAVASDVVMGGGFHPIYIHRSGYIGGLLACGSRRRFSVVGDDRPPTFCRLRCLRQFRSRYTLINCFGPRGKGDCFGD